MVHQRRSLGGSVKLFTSGERGRALCDRDGLVSTTYRYRDVPFSDGQGQMRDILVGVAQALNATAK